MHRFHGDNNREACSQTLVARTNAVGDNILHTLQQVASDTVILWTSEKVVVDVLNLSTAFTYSSGRQTHPKLVSIKCSVI